MGGGPELGSRPIIALTGSKGVTKSGWPSVQVDRRYARAVTLGGGLPLLVLEGEDCATLAAAASGLILTGGVDLSPEIYGQAREDATQVPDLERDAIEMALIDVFLSLRKPIFGICRGCHALNVRFGGNLWQDIPRRFGAEHGGGSRHPVEIEPQSALGSLFGHRAIVNSYHHQALGKLGEGLIPVATACVGDELVVEAIEHESYPLMGVQWHPERSLEEGGEETCMLALFRYFAGCCAQSR